MCTHTYINICMHAYIHKYMHTNARANKHTHRRIKSDSCWSIPAESERIMCTPGDPKINLKIVPYTSKYPQICPLVDPGRMILVGWCSFRSRHWEGTIRLVWYLSLKFDLYCLFGLASFSSKPKLAWKVWAFQAQTWKAQTPFIIIVPKPKLHLLFCLNLPLCQGLLKFGHFHWSLEGKGPF